MLTVFLTTLTGHPAQLLRLWHQCAAQHWGTVAGIMTPSRWEGTQSLPVSHNGTSSHTQLSPKIVSHWTSISDEWLLSRNWSIQRDYKWNENQWRPGWTSATHTPRKLHHPLLWEQQVAEPSDTYKSPCGTVRPAPGDLPPLLTWPMWSPPLAASPRPVSAPPGTDCPH